MRVMKLSCESRASAGAIKMSETPAENSTASRRPGFDKVHYYSDYLGGTLFKSVNRKLFMYGHSKQ